MGAAMLYVRWRERPAGEDGAP
ncbi:MAG: hypothetical protein QOI73_131, partial [Solirubrobacteraceae bacterium]|nr:hypothetical protein [Solirubrobacteraceae bacterium]